MTKRWVGFIVILLSLCLQPVLAATTSATVNITVDLTPPPAPTITVSPAGSWTNQNVTVEISGVVDNGPAGVEKVTYSTDDGANWTTDTSKASFSFSLMAEGIYPLKARTYDTAGHVSQEASSTVRIDRTNPTITVSGVAEGQVYYLPPEPRYEVADLGGSGVDPQCVSVALTTSDERPHPWADGEAITSEGSYILSLSASDSAGNRVNKTIQFTVSRPQAPTAPTLTAESTTEIEVSWSAVAGATGYQLIIDGQEPMDVGNVLSYLHSGLAANTQHTYSLVAYNQIGASDPGAPGSRWTWANLVTSLRLLNRNTTSIDVGWDGNGNSAATVYQVSLADTAGRDDSAQVEGSSLHHVFAGLELGVKYTISVVAVNGDGVASAAVTLDCYSNRSPVLALNTPVSGTVFSEHGESRLITVSGTVTDADRDDVTVTVSLDRVVKTATIRADGPSTFSLTYDVVDDHITEGNLLLSVIADDGK